MATTEYIQKRVAGVEAKLEKLNKKMGRILKAQASNWEVNPYYYSEYDLKATERDINEETEKLAKYREDLAKSIEKDNSRNVKVIVDFLERWQNRVFTHYKNMVPAYLEARKERYAENRAYCEWFNRSSVADKEERKARREAENRAKAEFKAAWAWIGDYMEYSDKLNEEKLQKDLKNEADRKYDFIIERTNEITGTITDASGLRIGEKDDLNGYIIGERGIAKVQTIGAGGYNIQCFHFRTLIHATR